MEGGFSKDGSSVAKGIDDDENWKQSALLRESGCISCHIRWAINKCLVTSGLRLGLTIERQNGRSNKKWLSNNTSHLINRV